MLFCSCTFLVKRPAFQAVKEGPIPFKSTKHMLLYISGEMTGLSSREGGFESLQESQTKKDYGGRSSIG